MIIDSQVHAYDANTPARPWHETPNWQPHVTGAEMVAAMDGLGVDGAILVSPYSLYRYDSSYAQEVHRAYPDRFALVKPVNPDDAAIAETLAEWKRTTGTVAVRIMFREPMRPADDPGYVRLMREVVRQDLPVNLLCWGHLDEGMKLIDRYPDVRFVVDHLALVQPRQLPVPAEPWSQLPQVVELAKRPNAVIKVSGACTLSHQPYPYPDIWDPLQRVFDAWGFDRCLWGTDWTRTFSLVNYAQGVLPFRLTDRLSESERAMLMGGACAKAYRWSPSGRPA